jgi:SAM-dependent methyltransferase
MGKDPKDAGARLFWDRKAEGYPSPLDPATLKATRGTLSMMRRLGAEWRGRDVLDIGCGTGLFALAMAPAARRVVGTDLSPRMLARMRKEAAAAGLRNVEALRADWKRFPAAALEGRFALAVASMTSAVGTPAEILRMEACAEKCAYVGWYGVRRNPVMEAVFRLHGLPYRSPEGASRVERSLKALGRRFRKKVFREVWRREEPLEKALRDARAHIGINGVRFRKKEAGELFLKLFPGGTVRQRTEARKALFVWSGPKRRP